MTRIEKEQHTVEVMIRMYCRHMEGNTSVCEECGELLKYARHRLSLCPYGEKKGSCRKCTIHCYQPEMAERMRAVMRYSGPRMIIYHPIHALRHIITELFH